MNSETQIAKEASIPKPILTNHCFNKDGTVYSLRYKRTLNVSLNAYGYNVLKVKHDDGKYRNVLVHRIIASLYIPNPLNLPTVNHIDGNKLNNDISNLEWMSIGDNVRHYVDATDKWERGAKAKLHDDSKYIRIQRVKNRTLITYRCRICDVEQTTRLDSTSVERGLCYTCAKQKEKGTGNAKY